MRTSSLGGARWRTRWHTRPNCAGSVVVKAFAGSSKQVSCQSLGVVIAIGEQDSN
jgi:hypothetical protein